MAPKLSRRRFLQTATVAAATPLIGLECPGFLDPATAATVVFRLSGRGRRISNAAKAYNANKRFKTAAVAAANRAHPGDTSKVVMITVSAQVYNQLFNNGRRSIGDMRDI